MAETVLNILVIPTYNSETLAIRDISTYEDEDSVSGASIEITMPGMDPVSIPFEINDTNVFNSTTLGLTEACDDQVALPDGIYTLVYTISPSYLNTVTKTIIRVDQLQEKFDSAFMKLDMMECDSAIKKQDKVELSSIYFLIQGAIAAANNCAVDTSNKLYQQANRKLNNFLRDGCNCSGSNFLINF